MVTRRQFLSKLAVASAWARHVPLRAFTGSSPLRGSLPDPRLGWRGESALAMGLRAGTIAALQRERRAPAGSTRGEHAVPRIDSAAVGAGLRRRFPHLRRHFVFEYYPWYATNPWRHWEQWERTPPVDIAATYMPRLGAYDSRSAAVVEQHARWIAESGAGGVNISWWGRDSFEDRAVPLVMDVMRDHGLFVTFHLEPYSNRRAFTYVDDVTYLLREYGEKRRWDAFLLIDGGDGRVGPVLKSFRTIVPPQVRDCHGRVFLVPDYVPDPTWRRQTDALRNTLRRDFDRITLLADVTDVERMHAAGFDGLAVYDNFLPPAAWRHLARACSRRDLVFSFNVNPGFDGIHLRSVEPDSCYVPTPIEPQGVYDWARAADREMAAARSRNRIYESFNTTLAVQTDASLTNARRGFFLTYLNSFNEWHEGHQFEPMKDAGELTPAERQQGYHNPASGDYRLRFLRELLSPVVE